MTSSTSASGSASWPSREARKVEVGFLRNTLELTAGNLSQHLGVLENAGLITIEKGYAGKRARTWITLTKAGHAALAEEGTHLKPLISQIERADTQHNRPAMPGG